jgi:predicted HTH domain antitoxin
VVETAYFSWQLNYNGDNKLKTIELKLHVPEDILYTLNETKNSFIKKMRLYAAIELYRLQKLSMGKASELAGMNKVDFMFELGKCEIPAINYDEEDFAEEVNQVMNQ